MPFVIPIPIENLQLLWAGIGVAFGRGFGKQLDQDIQNSEWYKRQPEWFRWIFKRVLDVMHHWWIGAILWLYAPQISAVFTQEIMWFGIGLLIDDLRDVPNLKRRYGNNGDDDSG